MSIAKKKPLQCASSIICLTTTKPMLESNLGQTMSSFQHGQTLLSSFGKFLALASIESATRLVFWSTETLHAFLRTRFCYVRTHVAPAIMLIAPPAFLLRSTAYSNRLESLSQWLWLPRNIYSKAKDIYNLRSHSEAPGLSHPNIHPLFSLLQV